MKTIGVRVGAPVAIAADTSILVCQAWPSKTLTAGSASLHRMWWPNFVNQTNVKRIHAVSSANDTYHVVPCYHAVFSIVSTAELSSKVTITHLKDNDSSSTVSLQRAEVFQSYLLASLLDVPVSIGQLFGLSWKTKPIILALESVLSDPSIDTQSLTQTKNSSKRLHVINAQTKITISSSSLTTAIPSVIQSNAQSNRSHPHYQLYDINHPNFMTEFGGYTEQVHESLTTILAGLGMINLPNIFHDAVSFPATGNQSTTDEIRSPLMTTTDTTVSHTNETIHDTTRCSSGYDELFPHLLHELLQPPKGLLIHGPPGTGKSKLMHSLAEVIQAMAMIDDATTSVSASAPARTLSSENNNDHDDHHHHQHRLSSIESRTSPPERTSEGSLQQAIHVPVHVLEISHAMLLGKYEGN